MKTSSKLLQNWSVLWQYSRKLHLQVTTFFKYWLNTFEYYHNTYEYCYNSCEYWAGEYTLSMFQEHETLMMILVYVGCIAKTFSFVLLFLKKCIYGLTFSHFSSLRLCHNLRITCRASFVLIRENVATLIEFLWTWEGNLAKYLLCLL